MPPAFPLNMNEQACCKFSSILVVMILYTPPETVHTARLLVILRQNFRIFLGNSLYYIFVVLVIIGCFKFLVCYISQVSFPMLFIASILSYPMSPKTASAYPCSIALLADIYHSCFNLIPLSMKLFICFLLFPS